MFHIKCIPTQGRMWMPQWNESITPMFCDRASAIEPYGKYRPHFTGHVRYPNDDAIYSHDFCFLQYIHGCCLMSVYFHFSPWIRTHVRQLTWPWILMFRINGWQNWNGLAWHVVFYSTCYWSPGKAKMLTYANLNGENIIQSFSSSIPGVSNTSLVRDQ